MSLRGRPFFRALACTVALVALGAACTGTDDVAAPTGSPTPVSPAPSSPSPRPAFELDVDLHDVRADGPGVAPRPRDLRAASAAVRATMAELYAIAFVDPARWDDGAFPQLPQLFAGSARERAADDLQRLTLGRAARSIDAVKPRRARLDVRFLTDAEDRPIAAIADMRFEGVALDGDDARPIAHDGEYTLRRVNGRWRIVAYDVRARVVGEAADAAFAPGLPDRDPMFVLVIGSDARPGQSVTGTRADSLHIVGVNPRLGRASVLGIPRDSWVPIPGAGSDKINAALVRGGPDLLVDTVERLAGIRIDAYVLTGFAGFEDVVGAIGGIDIRIPFPISDRYAHAQFREGPEHLTGNEALSFSRARHALSNGDFGRSLNQGSVLIAALATLRDEVRARGTVALLPWAVAGARFLRSDLSLVDIFELLLAAPAFDPERIRNEVVTGRVGSVGGRSVVFLDAGAAARFRDLARDGLLGG
ncbi:MAG: LCP family protein [Actinomycetota bacterium]